MQQLGVISTSPAGLYGLNSIAETPPLPRKRFASRRRASQPSEMPVTPDVPPVRRGPRIAQSALFATAFMTAILLTILGTFLSYTADALRIEQAWDILRFTLVVIVLLGVYLAYRVWTILFSQSRGQAAPLLHRRFVIIFSLAALAPAILVGTFSTTLLTQNLSGIFGEDVRNNMEEARQILDGYITQELSELGADAEDLREALSRNPGLLNSRITLTAELRTTARAGGLDAIYVLREDGFILARAESVDAPPLRIPSRTVLLSLGATDTALQKRADANYLSALSKISSVPDTYIYVGRLLRSDNQVLSSISGIEGASEQIERFNANQARMNQIFLLTFVNTALLILMAAIWLGLALANRIIDPLSGLINAAERVRSGDMAARVDVTGEWGEISDLGSAFNRMTSQLESQRDELVREHDVSEQRRQFSEAVLSGVSAGVIGLTQQGKITLMNQAATRLLEDRGEAIIGKPLSDVLSEFAPAFAKARDAIGGTADDQITLELDGGGRIFDLHVSAYQGARSDTGWVLTFDDMTRLVAAQRHSAWREVARRIAHEIKNPLTPIQLSAERLSRKYANEILTDRETFDNCTQTIIRQVGSLEQMVNEFSAFARMPEPDMAETDLISLLDETVFAQGVSFPDVRFRRIGRWPETAIVRGDARLLTQAFTNVMKNAGEAVQRKMTEGMEAQFEGEVTIGIMQEADGFAIAVTDNGPGWPVKDTDRLMEPYVTTRDGGTGLGLAIVKRIVEDHGGELSLTRREDASGARTILVLPRKTTPTSAPTESETL
jgi:two-component system nitrogen regulation sensor histidine kinase NtrY